jgi:hypothetical protein
VPRPTLGRTLTTEALNHPIGPDTLSPATHHRSGAALRPRVADGTDRRRLTRRSNVPSPDLLNPSAPARSLAARRKRDRAASAAALAAPQLAWFEYLESDRALQSSRSASEPREARSRGERSRSTLAGATHVGSRSHHRSTEPPHRSRHPLAGPPPHGRGATAASRRRHGPASSDSTFERSEP